MEEFSQKNIHGGGYFILLKRMDLGGFDSFGYLRYLLLNEIDRLEGNLSCCTIGEALYHLKFPLFLL
jgi:hypothetical protein